MALRAAPTLSSVSRPLVTRSAPKLCSRAASTSSSPSPSSGRTRQTLGTVALVSGGILLATYYLDSRSAIHRYVIPPLLRATTDAETAHLAAVKALALGLAPRDVGVDDPALEAELWGVKMSSPVGLAAGFDKHAEAMDGKLTLCNILLVSVPWSSLHLTRSLRPRIQLGRSRQYHSEASSRQPPTTGIPPVRGLSRHQPIRLPLRRLPARPRPPSLLHLSPLLLPILTDPSD